VQALGRVGLLLLVEVDGLDVAADDVVGAAGVEAIVELGEGEDGESGDEGVHVLDVV